MLKREFKDVLGGLVGVGRGDLGDVEGMAHQAASWSDWRFGARNGADGNKNLHRFA
jgi:hypothetical protein